MNFKYYDPTLENIYDRQNLGRKLRNIRESKNDLVVGAIRMFKNGEMIQDISPNLVVAIGRQYVAQRIFGLAHPSETEVATSLHPDIVNIWDWKITHFGVGSGGALTVGSYVNMLGPEACDLDLYEPIPLSGSPGDASYLTSPGDSYKGIAATPFVVKSIKPSGTIDIVASTDLDCSFGQTYSYVRVVCTKASGEPNYLEYDDDYLNINEAALYYSNGETKVRTFAHICFTPKYIEKKSELVIEWYIMC